MSNVEVIDGDDPLIGSKNWYEFLELPTTSSFRYESAEGSFTCRKRTNGAWNAYRKMYGKLRQEYVGLSKALTPDKLKEVAAKLAQSDRDYWLSKSQSKKVRQNQSITLSPNPDFAVGSELADALKKIDEMEKVLTDYKERTIKLEEIVDAAQLVVRSMIPNKSNMVRGDALVRLRDKLSH